MVPIKTYIGIEIGGSVGNPAPWTTEAPNRHMAGLAEQWRNRWIDRWGSSTAPEFGLEFGVAAASFQSWVASCREWSKFRATHGTI